MMLSIVAAVVADVQGAVAVVVVGAGVGLKAGRGADGGRSGAGGEFVSLNQFVCWQISPKSRGKNVNKAFRFER